METGLVKALFVVAVNKKQPVAGVEKSSVSASCL